MGREGACRTRLRRCRHGDGGYLRLDLLADERRAAYGPALGVATAVGGVLLITWAWVSLGRQVRGLPRVGVVQRTALLWTLPLLLAPPVFSGDGWSYAADGYITGHGLSPYVVTPGNLHGPIIEAVSHRWYGTPAPYGPLPMVWGGFFAHLTSDPWELMLPYRLLALASFAVLLHVVPRLAGIAGIDAATAVWLGVASPFVLTQGIGGMHLDLAMVGFLAVAFMMAARGRWVAGAILVGAAAAVKAPGLVAVFGVALLSLPPSTAASRLLRTGQVAAVASAVLAGSGFIAGLGVGWLHALGETMAVSTPLSLTNHVGQLLSAILSLRLDHVVGVAALVAIALVCLLTVLMTRTDNQRNALVAGAAVLAAATVLSPVTHYWYFLWCLPILACCPLPRRWVGIVLGLVAAIGIIGPLDPRLHIPYTTPIVLAVVLGFVAAGYRGLFEGTRPRAVPGAVREGAPSRT